MLAQGEEGKQKRCAGEAGCYATRYAALNDSRNDHLPQGCVSDLKDLEVDKKLQKLAPEHQRALLMCQDEKLWDKCFYVSLEEPGNPLLICCCTKNDMNKTSCKYLHRTRMYGHALDH
ncbi:hypothetical protein L596_014215 [Steinernema carpocapsae]|uniref:Uncharacterized protein n=1 Tax=Steinernema carpocapsae TaxID=34508 RepID=A0A4U5NB81_STECR|nr:hypothetical protein L596_014215 [Steinernema carpocapsae]